MLTSLHQRTTCSCVQASGQPVSSLVASPCRNAIPSQRSPWRDHLKGYQLLPAYSSIKMPWTAMTWEFLFFLFTTLTMSISRLFWVWTSHLRDKNTSATCRGISDRTFAVHGGSGSVRPQERGRMLALDLCLLRGHLPARALAVPCTDTQATTSIARLEQVSRTGGKCSA